MPTQLQLRHYELSLNTEKSMWAILRFPNFALFKREKLKGESITKLVFKFIIRMTSITFKIQAAENNWLSHVQSMSLIYGKNYSIIMRVSIKHTCLEVLKVILLGTKLMSFSKAWESFPSILANDLLFFCKLHVQFSLLWWPLLSIT